MLRVFLIFFAILDHLGCAIHSAPHELRIVGGEDAELGQFPHQVSMQRRDGSYSCGGSILNERFILTAAHCVVDGNSTEPNPAKFWVVRVGSIQRSTGGTVYKIKRAIVNQAYGSRLNDVALMELETPLEWTDYVKPIELASEEVPSGEEVIISGFGRVSKGGLIPNFLKWNTAKALTTQECQQAINWIQDCIICLAHLADNGACNGDSGGPAIYNGKLVGVANFVFNGCGSTLPDGYAKVAYHRDWILEHMQPENEIQ